MTEYESYEVQWVEQLVKKEAELRHHLREAEAENRELRRAGHELTASWQNRAEAAESALRVIAELGCSEASAGSGYNCRLDARLEPSDYCEGCKAVFTARQALREWCTR